MRKKLTIKELLANKGRKVYSEVHVKSVEEARACEEAGIDMLILESDVEMAREASPSAFLIVGAMTPDVAISDAGAIRVGLNRMSRGADAVYTGQSLTRVRAMAQEKIPIVGHVGLVPYRNSWYGGMKPVGKTADEAVQIYKDVLAYQEAGAIAVEMELVPEMVAAEISKRVSILTIALGSGQGCDVQYLFACDILNITEGHIPRHAKSYVDLQPERKRLHEKSVQGFADFHREVTSCQFPRPGNNLKISEEEFDRFLTHAQALG